VQVSLSNFNVLNAIYNNWIDGVVKIPEKIPEFPEIGQKSPEIPEF
jgi:hypothetical protein